MLTEALAVGDQPIDADDARGGTPGAADGAWRRTLHLDNRPAAASMNLPLELVPHVIGTG